MRLRRPAHWLGVVAVLVYLGIAAQGFGPHLSDDHAFRQTQTALTARYLSAPADLWRYETPVLGVPWQAPFEFPVMQALAKLVHLGTGLSLTTSGRLVSMAFFLGCLWPLCRLAQAMGLQRTGPLVALVVLMPLHVFWSRAFMIETTALFFSLMYAWALWQSLQVGSARALVLLGFFGTLAALTKATTWLPVMTSGLVAAAWMLWRRHLAFRPGPMLGVAVVHGVVLAAALAWIQHTDRIKAAQPLARSLTSQALQKWNYGTWDQRMDPQTWRILLDRTASTVADVSPDQPERQTLLAGGVLLTFAVSLMLAPARSRQLALALLLPYGLAWAMFTNLHLMHNYYQCAAAVFLALAVAVAFDGALTRAEGTSLQQPLLRPLLWLMLVAVLVGMAQSSWSLMERKSSHRVRNEPLVQSVRTHSPADTAILVDGLDWNSELAWRAERRALMVPDWIGAEARAQAIVITRAQWPVSLYISCRQSEPLLQQRLAALGLSGAQPLDQHAGCRLFRLP
jgi:Dolichyl-phosphate-mannose-protein mannosyltransferase